jgi:hypothetical protein
MLRPIPALNKFVVIAAICAAAWGICNWLIWLPDETTRLRDDAFYEFAWAANVAAGRGATVSDGVTTSGVQLLWSLLLVPFAWLWSPAALPWVAPMLGTAFHIASAFVIRNLSQDRLTGNCLLLCWLGHPLLLREAQNGQETAMAVFFAASLVVARKAPERWFLPLSVLAVLARSDLLALVVCLSIYRHHRKTTVRGWLALVPTPLLAFLLPAACNRLLGGGWLPDSAMPMAWLFHTNLIAANGEWSSQWWFTRPVLLGGPFATASTFGFGLVAFQLIRPWWPVALRVVPAVSVGIASALGVSDLLTAGWAALLLALFPAVRRRRISCRLLAVTAGLAAIVVVHWAVRWYPRDYYLAPLVVVAFVAMARSGRWRILLLAFAVVQVQDSWRIQPEPLAGQREMRAAGQFLNQVLPAGERVGSFNSGLLTFYADVLARDDLERSSTRRAVINLDGVVDARSFAALQRGQLSQWLDQQGVRFLLDSPIQFELDPAVAHACGMHFGDGFDPADDLVEVARFDVPGITGALPRADSMRLYWRRNRGAMPERPVPMGEVRMLAGSSINAAEPESCLRVWWGARAGESLVYVHLDGRRELLVQVDVDTAVLLEMPGTRSDQDPPGHFDIESH